MVRRPQRNPFDNHAKYPHAMFTHLTGVFVTNFVCVISPTARLIGYLQPVAGDRVAGLPASPSFQYFPFICIGLL